MSKTIVLTTEDNPYSPFEEFEQWYMFDIEKGYNTCERIASISIMSDSLTPEENNDILEKAIDEVIDLGAISNEGKRISYKKLILEDKNDD